MWLIYLLAMFTLDMAIYANGPISPVSLYYLLNGLPAVLFLVLTYLIYLKKIGIIIFPFLIVLITLTPILINTLFNIHLPPAPLSNLEGMVLWQLPVLFIGMVLVAWSCRLGTIILYSLGVNLGEVVIVFAVSLSEQLRQPFYLYIIAIRTVCFIVVGVFINRLVNILHLQQVSLKAANDQLTHYASTLENLTVSRERNRMSRELHDTVVHTLSGLIVQLETTKAYWDVEPETAKGYLDSSLKATRTGLEETRRAVKDLRASPLGDLGLVGALKDLLNNAGQRGNLAVECALPDNSLLLSPDVEQSIYRIAQEAVENVVHHANARHLIIQMKVVDKDITLLIQDDGIGFDPGKNIPAGHYGLSGMRERATLVGGGPTIHSQPQKGTKIALSIIGCVR
jgi:signal transduction histidine kinase